MVIVNKCRNGRDLNSVGVVGRVLKQAVVRIEQFPGEQEEELSGRTTVVEALLSVESDVQLWLLQVLLGRGHDFVERVL